MRAYEERGPSLPGGLARWLSAPAVLAVLGVLTVWMMYAQFRIEVPTGHQAVLIRKAGLDLEPGMELAPPPTDGRDYKGVQAGGAHNGVLTEGRYFYNPFFWTWEIKPQFEVPQGKIGVRVALVGADLPPGEVLAEPGQKGILRAVLPPGRYPYNWYAEAIELHDPVTVPAGSRGVVTLLAGRPPKDPNVVLVGPGERGVQKETLPPGTYYLNPYETHVSLVDCRSQRFDLGYGGEMDFLSADGFPVTIDGAVEFRVIEGRAAEVFVLYNEDDNGDEIGEEIIRKIITPESRSICRIGGSKLTGGEFISGLKREKFQADLDKALKENCKRQGVEVLAVAVTSIRPPEAIAQPVRDREVAKQQLAQFEQERLQQLSEAQLKVQQLLAEQKKALVEAEQGVVEQTTKAEQDQEVAVTLAEQKLQVAETQLEAARDKARAIEAEAQAAADVIRFKIKAELSGLAARVEAFDGDGAALAHNILLTKVAPAFRSILTNADGPLMDLFGSLARPADIRKAGPPSPTVELPSNPFDTSNAEARR